MGNWFIRLCSNIDLKVDNFLNSGLGGRKLTRLPKRDSEAIYIECERIAEVGHHYISVAVVNARHTYKPTELCSKLLPALRFSYRTRTPQTMEEAKTHGDILNLINKLTFLKGIHYED